MEGEAAFIALITAFHVVGGALLGGMLWSAFRRDAGGSRGEDEGDDGRGNVRPPDGRPGGPGPDGVPLPDARPARVRLRDGERLADLLPGPDRRPAHPPAPAPDPAREREPA
ncbi:MAG TPA: hypothetical protein VK279_06435 [Solirubrobacteraceae bacterium]|nr:hypothetical protein [Solirubrobacteraceae bacterium]